MTIRVKEALEAAAVFASGLAAGSLTYALYLWLKKQEVKIADMSEVITIESAPEVIPLESFRSTSDQASSRSKQLLWLEAELVAAKRCASCPAVFVFTPTIFNATCSDPVAHKHYMQNMLSPQKVKAKSNEIIAVIKEWSASKKFVRVADIGAGSGAVYFALKEEIERNPSFPKIQLLSIEAGPQEEEYLRNNCPNIEEILEHFIFLENGLHPSEDHACDILVLNSVVHEIISYGCPETHKRYERSNFQAFMKAWAGKVSPGGLLFFRDFVKPEAQWKDGENKYRAALRPKTQLAQEYLPILFSDLDSQFDVNPLQATYKESECAVLGTWESIMEILASFQWGSLDNGTRGPDHQSVLDEQFIHFSTEEIKEIVGKFGFNVKNVERYTSMQYFEKWTKHFDIHYVCDSKIQRFAVGSTKQMPTLKASMSFTKV